MSPLSGNVHDGCRDSSLIISLPKSFQIAYYSGHLMAVISEGTDVSPYTRIRQNFRNEPRIGVYQAMDHRKLDRKQQTP